MNKLLVVVAAVALPLVSATASADILKLPVAQSNVLAVEMSNAELDAVQGGAFDICVACLLNNTAVVTQANVSLLSLGALQSNTSGVIQSNN